MRRSTTLESRLTDWAKEYGGGKYGIKATIEDGVVTEASYGDSPLASMMKWHGRPPDGLGYHSSCTAADEVDEAVRALSQQPQGLLPSIIITLEYWLPGQPLESKQGRLRRRGDNVSRAGYYNHLRVARVHIAAWLHIPFSESAEQFEKEACV